MMRLSVPSGRCPMMWFVLVVTTALLAGCGATAYPDAFAMTGAPQPAPRGDAGAALMFARATRQAGDLQASLQIYRGLVVGKSVTPDIKVEFGDVLLESGAAEDAIDVYSQIGTGSPARLGALLGLTRASIILGDPTKALDYSDQSQRLAPKEPRMLVDRGVVLDSLDRHAEAQDCYRAVLAVSPRHVSARNNLALSLAMTKNFDESLAIITALARSSSATPQVRENMAVIYGLMGDPAHAAIVSRTDLDESTTQANLAFLATVRGRGP